MEQLTNSTVHVLPQYQFLGADEGQFAEGYQVDTDSEKRKQIIDILVTWYQATPASSLEILEFLKVLSALIS